MFQNIVTAIASCCTGDSKMKIKGTVVLMKKNVLEFNDFPASVLDLGHELLGQRVSLQVISAAKSDPPGIYNSSFVILLLIQCFMPFQSHDVFLLLLDEVH
jgi:linoleate 9S-lipoxygenase